MDAAMKTENLELIPADNENLHGWNSKNEIPAKMRIKKMPFGFGFVFENVMFDIIYLFIYIFEKNMVWERSEPWECFYLIRM